jgi:hypothetical protein
MQSGRWVFREGNTVVGFRAVYSEYKGMMLILAALLLSARYPGLRSLLSFPRRAACHGLSSRYQIIDTGWIKDAEIASITARWTTFHAVESGSVRPDGYRGDGCWRDANRDGGYRVAGLGWCAGLRLCSEHSDDAYADVVELAVRARRAMPKGGRLASSLRRTITAWMFSAKNSPEFTMKKLSIPIVSDVPPDASYGWAGASDHVVDTRRPVRVLLGQSFWARAHHHSGNCRSPAYSASS